MKHSVLAALVAALTCLWATSILAAPVTVQEATLYVSAPAEVSASVALDGGAATFDLPKGLAPDSLQAVQGGAPVSVTVQPIYGPARDPLPPHIERYQAQLTDLRPGVPVSLRFRARGLSWVPAMSLQFSAGQSRLQVQASLTSQALDLTGARLRLMSGRVAGARDTPPRFYDFPGYEWYDDVLADYGRAPGERDRGALHLLTELPAGDFPAGATRQVPLLSASIDVSRTYRWDTYARPRDPDLPVARSPERPHAVYTFPNTTGQPLPEGTVTVSEGSTVLGDGYLAWTPSGETAVIGVASVRDLVVRRKHETAPMPQTWETQHRVSLQVESTREEPLTVRVAEHLSSEWDYGWDDEGPPAYEFSLQPEVGEEDVFTWNLPVPARGRAEVTYSYTEPIDLDPLRLVQIVPDDSPQERQYILDLHRAAVQYVRDPSQQRIRRVQAGGYVIYRLPVPADVTRADLMVGGANTLRVSAAPQVSGKPGAFKVVADLVAIAGRPVDDASNYNTFIFDLAPFLGESRVAYVRLDNPSGGEAFFAWVEVYRVPEGFSSRGREYAVGEAAAEAAPRRVLFSFIPGTPAEEECIFLDRGAGLNTKFEARTIYLDQKIVYRFAIPPDVSGAGFIVDAWGAFAVAVARDVKGAPSEFHEELNALALLGRQAYEGRARRQYALDLSPYLEDNPSRTIYVAMYSADPTTGWGGAFWRQIEVVALDDAEKAHLAHLRRQTDDFVKEDRAHHPLDVRVNSKGADAPYLYRDRGSTLEPHARIVGGSAEVIYRLPLKPEYQGAQLLVWVLGDSLVSYATDDRGKPGAFTDVFRARDKFGQTAIRTYTNPGHAEIPITRPMLDAGAVYVRIRDCAPGEPGPSQIHTLSIRLP